MEELQKYMHKNGYIAEASELVEFVIEYVKDIKADPWGDAVAHAFDDFFDNDATSVERSTICGMIEDHLDANDIYRPPRAG